MKVTNIRIATPQALVEFTFENGDKVQLSFEFLRVFSPQPGAKQSLVSHKKQVKLTAVEPVAKFGFRLSFDDNHQNIYSDSYLLELCQQQDALWQSYEQQIAQSPHSREASIDFKAV